MEHSIYIFIKLKLCFHIDINCFNKKRDEYMTSHVKWHRRALSKSNL